MQAADQAVKTVEKVFLEYKKHHLYLLKFICATLNSQKAEDIFRKVLCEQIGEFYSINIMLKRIEQIISGGIIFYPENNILTYIYDKNIILRSGLEIHKHESIIFSSTCYIFSAIDNAKQYILVILGLSLLTLISGLSDLIKKKNQTKFKRRYQYAIAVIGDRQLRNNNRRADFIVDNDKIKSDDVVYIPLMLLNAVQTKELLKLKGDVFFPPNKRRNFGHFSYWIKMLWISLRERFLRNTNEIKVACHVLFEYFRWKDVNDKIEFRHFITHCDFGYNHIARNIALSQNGVQTWYFTDSMNNTGNYRIDYSCHTYWTYLTYDNFITWDDFIKEYYLKHPNNIKNVHDVGCLWSSDIREKKSSLDNKFVIAAFDTTYSQNSITSYSEGIAFAQDLYKLVNEFKEIILIMKEKKSSDAKYHAMLDPILGPVLLSLYEKMNKHDRIKNCSNQTDAADIMSDADMIISFPFTSTTFEALSANKPAIWHDPKGYYKNTPYGKIGGVVTHSYDELKSKVLEIMSLKKGEYKNPIPKGSPLMDPYCDGNALKRFRKLIIS